MYENGISEAEEDTRDILTVKAPVTKIAQGVVDGNSHYYIMVEGSEDIFDIPVTDFIDIIRYDVGDEVTIEYRKGEKTEYRAVSERCGKTEGECGTECG